jgi:hypothetical protein
MYGGCYTKYKPTRKTLYIVVLASNSQETTPNNALSIPSMLSVSLRPLLYFYLAPIKFPSPIVYHFAT